METKKCSKCIEISSVAEFDKGKNTKDGYSPWCKKCRREYARNYSAKRKHDPEWQAAKKVAKGKYRASEKGQKHQHQYREAYRSDPEVKQHELEYGRAYYEVHKEKRTKVARQWVCDNPERMKELRKRAYNKRRKNPIMNLGDRVRRALKRAIKKNGLCKNGMSFELLGYTAIEAYQHLSKNLGQSCEVCGKTVVMIFDCHLDHIKPIHLAKSLDTVIEMNQLENLRLICGPCNLKKGPKF